MNCLWWNFAWVGRVDVNGRTGFINACAIICLQANEKGTYVVERVADIWGRERVSFNGP